MNSQIEQTESVTLVSKLIDRTRERKLKWKTYPSSESEKSSSFSTQLDTSQMAVISQREDGFLEFSLVEHDPRWSEPNAALFANDEWTKTKAVLEIAIEKDPSYGYDTQEESDLSKLLVNLYELARRSAYQIDASVGKAISYLDKLAV